MTEVVGIKFRCAGKLYYFGPNGIKFERGDRVVVETARGSELGTVTMPNREVPDEEIYQPLKEVIRKGTEEDIASEAAYRAKEADAFAKCKEKIRERGIDMKLVEVEYLFDGSKVIFYFTADGRVDFRELVKDLASMFRTRIELRQIGVRDETVIRGGIGVCGRCLCCKTYLNDFVSVSIKMAKEQNLSLNPAKISGICGRLMCCLKNEEETYEYLNSTLPRVGDDVYDKFEGTKGTVTEVNVLKQKVKVRFASEDGGGEIKEYKVDELDFKRKKIEYTDDVDDEELKAIAKVDENVEDAYGEEQNRKKNNHHDSGKKHNNHNHEKHHEHFESGNKNDSEKHSEHVEPGKKNDGEKHSEHVEQRHEETQHGENHNGENTHGKKKHFHNKHGKHKNHNNQNNVNNNGNNS